MRVQQAESDDGGRSAKLTQCANGNLTRDETDRQFVYDAWNRLVAVKDAAGATLKSYAYDGLHRRVQESAGGTTTDLYYSDAWQVLEERVTSGGTSVPRAQYVWSPVYVDALVLSDRDTNGDGTLDERLYVVQDANYNVTALFDNAGTIVERYVYDPFGQVTVLDPGWNVLSASAFAWNYLHQGGRFDATSGLYHFRYRDYSPTLGRWISLDPIRYEAGDVNLFRYVFNAPTIYTDPSGLEHFESRIARQELEKKLKEKQRLAELERQQRLWNEMRERMKEITHKLKLPEAERQAIMDDLERLIDIARNEPHPGQLSGNCYTWVDCVMKKYRVNPKTYKWIKVGSQAWEYYIGIPFTKHWFGHIAIKIELPDGSIYYLDDGWWGRIFKPDDIPWYVHEYPRPDRSGKRLGPECFYDLNYRKGPH